MGPTQSPASGIRVIEPSVERNDEVLTPEAVAFVADLGRAFRVRVDTVLESRVEAQAQYDHGHFPGFLESTREIRDASWSVAPLPPDLTDRRVEITGPVDRKMVINALNSGASCFMADFEDATSPTWRNLIEGQVNLKDAVAGTIEFTQPETGKEYRLNPRHATLLVRPRGWHLEERHFEVDGRAIPGALLDFGLFFFHNAQSLLENGSGPYFYLPKLQGHLEARLWNDVFCFAQDALGIGRGSIRATVLIETLPAAFEMEEILYELRDHCAGLNCGRWDYIFSYIKTLRSSADHVLPDRGQVVMVQPFMRAYTQLAVKTCHRRGASAMGGMAAQIPIKGDGAANDAAMSKVRADKLREAQDGHDGTWVAHPGLVPIAREIFDAEMPGPNQIGRLREDVQASAADLLEAPTGTRTVAGLRQNVNVGIRYLQAWLAGNGCVPLDNLMEDAATAEISRAQVWQWLRHGAELEDGTRVTPELFQWVLDEEVEQIGGGCQEDGFQIRCLEEAAALFDELSTSEDLADFLTLRAYDKLLDLHDEADCIGGAPSGGSGAADRGGEARP